MHRLSILLLADDQKGHPNAIHDHIQAFRRHSRHRVELFNPRGLDDSRFLDLDAFDVVVIHYSIVIIWDDYLSPTFRERIAGFGGLKVHFLQDEYRFVDAVTAEMRRLGIDVLYSVAPESQWPEIYGGRLSETEILPTLTGYVPRRLVGRRTAPLAERPIDVGYRGRSLPFWLGRLGFEKIEIGRGFLERVCNADLRLDIAWTEGARVHGERWNTFVQSCRTMLASESGSSLVDFEGSIEHATREYIAANPVATYAEVERDVLVRFDGGPSINTASPRIFESAALGTAMVMFSGEYSGIVRPWVHYVPLEKDFSNLDEVVARIRDSAFLEQLAQRAYDDLIASDRYSEEAWIRSFDEALAQRAVRRGRLRSYPRRRLAIEQLSVGRSYRVSALYWLARKLILAYLGIKVSMRRRPLRRLLLRARRARSTGETSLWDDLFRLAMISAVHTRALTPEGEPFEIAAHFDRESGRLTLTSTPAGAPAVWAAVDAAVESAIHERVLREIVWNHAPLGQYVTLKMSARLKRISFDVGRYDAFGVYRFDALVALAHETPQLVLDALRPLLAPSPGPPTYRLRPRDDTTHERETTR